MEDALFDVNDKLDREREECCKYKDVVVDFTSNDFERARWNKGNLQLYEEQISFLVSSELEPDSADESVLMFQVFFHGLANGEYSRRDHSLCKS